MSTEWRASAGQPPKGGEAPIRVFTCGRIGMQANPPRRRLGRLLRRR